MKKPFLFLTLIFCIVFYSCQDEALSSMEETNITVLDLPGIAFDYESDALPANFRRGRPSGGAPPPPPPNQGNPPRNGNNPAGGGNAATDNDNTPNNNAITNEGATLGRVLFYDKNLSRNRTIACASCHIQDKGFSDPNMLSDGFLGGKTRRHSMSLGNARFYQRGRFFWDERAVTLEEQVLMPIQDEVEMGLDLVTLVERVEAEPYYNQLFVNAFGNEEVDSDKISIALSQFVRSLVTFESKYDVGSAQVNNPNDNFPNFTTQENLGKRLFFGRGNQGLGCDRCHDTEAFIANRPTNNGLDAASTDDQGLFETTGNRRDIGLFKVPSLRNIAVTAPYMHDGRFETLAEVIEHYNSGVQAHPNLSRELRGPNNTPRRLNLNQNEKSALLAFFQTLTDTNFLSAEKFSDPFLP